MFINLLVQNLWSFVPEVLAFHKQGAFGDSGLVLLFRRLEPTEKSKNVVILKFCLTVEHIQWLDGLK